MVIYFRFGMKPVSEPFCQLRVRKYYCNKLQDFKAFFFICNFGSGMLQAETYDRCSILYTQGHILYSLPHPVFSHPPTEWVLGPLSAAVEQLGHS